MEVPVYSLAGEVVSQIELSDDVFAVPFNQAVVHQAMVRQQANARQGTASTKARSEVAGSTRKLHRQKGTGLARAGSRKSPIRTGGGVTFGPKPRSFQQAMPKKMRRLALRCLLSTKARDGDLKVLEDLDFEQPKTRDMVRILAALGANSSALIAKNEPGDNIIKASRNLSGIKIIPARLLNVVDLLSHKMLIITVAAVKQAEELWGQTVTPGEVNASV